MSDLEPAPRPLSLGSIFAEAGRLYLAHGAVFVGLTAAVVVPCGLLQGLVLVLLDDPSSAVAALAVLKHLGSAIALGIVVRLGADHFLGRRTTLAEAIAEVRPRVLDLLVTDLVAAGRLLLVSIVPFFLLGLLFAGTTWLAVVVFWLALLLLAGCYLLGGFWVSFTVQLVVLEGLTPTAAVARSLRWVKRDPLPLVGVGLPFGLLLAATAVPLLAGAGGGAAPATMALALACSLAQAAIAPLAWTAAMVLYHELCSSDEATADERVIFGQG